MKAMKPDNIYKGLLLMFFLVIVSSAAVPANRTIIKFGTIAPEGSAWHDAMLELRQKWLELSNDQIELRIYAGGVLGGETEMVRKVQRRGLDGIAISGSGLPRIDSSIGCLDIPMLFDSYEQLDYVRKQISPDIEQRFEKRGFKILVWAEGGWVYFFTKRPVRTPDDLRQLRLWTTPGFPEYERIFKEFKFQVVPLSATDMMTSLQTGLIEAIDVPPLFALLDRSYQIANYMTDLKWAPLNAAMVLSVNMWNKIPQHLHPGFLDAAADIGGRLRQTIREAENEALAEMRARGLTVVKLNDNEISVWRSEVRSAYIKFPCQQEHPELFNKILRLHKEYRQKGIGLN